MFTLYLLYVLSILLIFIIYNHILFSILFINKKKQFLIKASAESTQIGKKTKSSFENK